MMPFRVDSSGDRPLYLQITDEVRRLIALKELVAEDAMPSVRQLAGDLRINHNTVAQAYRELERQGIVYVRRGQGTFVTPQSQSANQLAQLAAQVAARAILDAHRHGMNVDELILALEQSAPNRAKFRRRRA
jgi:GntR family transcriptional regulator